jgi:hypothetical protein
MYEQVMTGLRAAKTSGMHRMSEDNMRQTASQVVEALSLGTDRIPPRVEVLTEPTTVVSMGAVDMVAMIARASTRVAQTTGLQMGTETVQFGPEFHEHRWLLWKLQHLFGVWVFASPHNCATTAQMAGYPSDRAALLTVYRGLVEAGQRHVETWTSEAKAEFWTTVGLLVAESDRGKEQCRLVAERCVEARVLCERAFGSPKIVPSPLMASDGTDVYKVAAKTLAEVVL